MIGKNSEAPNALTTGASDLSNPARDIDMKSISRNELIFHNTVFNPVVSVGTVWLTSAELAAALEYQTTKAITNLYNQYSDEFTEGMTQVLESRTSGNYRKKVRVFSLRGAHLIAMFSRTPVAKEFRRWVLDILDREALKPSNELANPVRRAIRRREDLSFTKRDANGCLINWNVPTRQDCWHENVRIGQEFFKEVIELAHNNPQEAYDALECAGVSLVRFSSTGQAFGFMEHLARWAMAGLLGSINPEGLKIKLTDISKEPMEGAQHYFSRVH